MTLTVHTARVSYDGADRLDVTRKSAGPDGIAFAPSWAILRPALDLMQTARSSHSAARHITQATHGNLSAESASSLGVLRVAPSVIADAAWALYSAAYAAEMRESYRTQRAAWRALLARESVTLVCYCTDPARCHRTLLAGIFAKLGAINEGERR